MGKAVPLPGIQPALLKWARESAHLSLEEVAGRLKKAVEEIEAWESPGAHAPSYAQLEKLAYELYKRPLAIFFLPAPPDEPKPEAEFRALPEADLRRLSRETVFLIRRARAYQASLVELFAGRSPVADPLWRRVSLDASKSVAPQAGAVRAALGMPEPGSDEWGAADGDELQLSGSFENEVNPLHDVFSALEDPRIGGRIKSQRDFAATIRLHTF